MMKQYNIKVNGKAYDVVIDSVDQNGAAKVSVDGKEYVVEMNKAGEASPSIQASPVQTPSVQAPAPAFTAPSAPAPVAASNAETAAAGGQKVVTTPLPGVIIEISVNIGDSVKAGQSVATLEAMKMENAIEAEADGVVKAIHVQKGDSVLEGAKIVTLG